MTDTTDFEQSFARLVRLADHLAAVEQSSSDNAPALKVEGTSFVHLAEPHIAVLHCPMDQKVLLMEISPEIFFETDSYIGRDAVMVRLEKISDEELALKLEDAWMFTAPERLRRDRT